MDEIFWFLLGGGAAYLLAAHNAKGTRSRTSYAQSIPMSGTIGPISTQPASFAAPSQAAVASAGISTGGLGQPLNQGVVPAPGVGVGTVYKGAPYRGAVYDPSGLGSYGTATPAVKPGAHASFGGSRTPGGGIGYASRIVAQGGATALGTLWAAPKPDDCDTCDGGKVQ